MTFLNWYKVAAIVTNQQYSVNGAAAGNAYEFTVTHRHCVICGWHAAG